MTENTNHKAGYVNILGNPNVGKSTLMNVLVGERLSIITSKAQTTRHRILGIVNGDDIQIIYSDTPGILKPKYLLQESMMKFVTNALTDADLILYVTSMNDAPLSAEFFEKLKTTETPIVLIVNKIDIAKDSEVEAKIEECKQVFPFTEVIPISAMHQHNINHLFERIKHYMPLHPGYFPKDELTDKPMRFFTSEIIREKILQNYSEEIPYCSEVIVESFKDEEKIIRIRAEIIVARDTQKGIIIGHKGQALKKVGTEARLDLEDFLQKKVFLELYVRVEKDWRQNKNYLRRFGYEM